jgi:CubicO group peptidase (beta-lactamase class C family)
MRYSNMGSKYLYRAVVIMSLFFVSTSSMAQTREQQKTDSVYQLVKKQFNAKNADSLYALAGAALKKDLIPETFRNICNNNLFPLGKITGETLVSFQNNKIATYKLTFDTSDPFNLMMSLDDQDKLQLFLLKPFTPPVGNKMEEALSSNLLKTEIDKKIDGPARTYIQKANTVGLSIGIIKDGQIYTYGYGETIRDKNKIPTANSIFEIGSITKTFTATLLAYYAEEGKVKLNDPITKYLPDSVKSNPNLKGITLEMLANHTSGLPRLPEDFFSHATDALNPYKDYTKKLMFSYLKTCKPVTAPGELYAYSNYVVGLMGEILAHVSGKTYDQMVSEIITKPLQMNSTVEYITPQLNPRFVKVYNETGNQTNAWDWDALAPAGALRSTVNNMLTYCKANMATAPTRLSKAMALTHQVTYNKDIKVGLGWHIITVNGIDYYFHDGGTGGCSSFLAFNIEKNVAVVILSNSAESTYATGVDILKQLDH